MWVPGDFVDIEGQPLGEGQAVFCGPQIDGQTGAGDHHDFGTGPTQVVPFSDGALEPVALVGVDADVVERFGAVSAQTVCQMASGVKKTAGATYGLGISGIAGPGGGTPEKPVGTVHFALAGPTGTYHRQVLLAGRSRDQVRQASVYIAASLLLWTLQGEDMSDRPVSGPYSEDEVWAEGGIQDTPITKAQ